MKNGECGAFAKYGEGEHQKGLNKREYFAGLAMQGLLANSDVTKWDDKQIIEYSVMYSDKLLKELEK